MNKAYVISLVTAVSLGYVAGFTTDGITSADTQPYTLKAKIFKTLGDTAEQTLDNFLVNQICPEVASTFGTPVEDCSATTFKTNGVVISWEDDLWKVSVIPEIAGTWSPGSPQ